MWWYTLGVLVLWVINPELRRFADWSVGDTGHLLFPMLPFVALVPHAWSLTLGGGWRRLPSALVIAAWAWLGIFSYAFVLALVSANVLPGAYTFADFVSPIGLGLWIAADRSSAANSLARVGRLLFALTTVISVYGIVQYVAPLPWDVQWLQNVIKAGSLSFGRPLPFQIRVFSMLASPGPFGNFMAVMLLLALPQLTLRRPWLLVQIPIWLIAFGLSLDRSGWLIFAVGALTYLILTPRRTAFLTTASAGALLLVALVTVLPTLLDSEGLFTTLSDRLATLSSLEDDKSGHDRQNLYEQQAQSMFDTPLGLGLGVVGAATQLSDGKSDFAVVDSGILSRLIEMGLPGLLALAATFAYLLAALIRRWRKAGRDGDAVAGAVASMAISVEIGLLSLELSGDVSGILVLALWMVIGLALRTQLERRPQLEFAFGASLA